jgi:hypothetical protein
VPGNELSGGIVVLEYQGRWATASCKNNAAKMMDFQLFWA